MRPFKSENKRHELDALLVNNIFSVFLDKVQILFLKLTDYILCKLTF